MKTINFFGIVSMIAICSLAAVSCQVSKKINKASHKQTTEYDSASHSVDSTVTKSSLQQTETIYFGDTLAASLQFTDEQINAMDSLSAVKDEAVDSAESNGIKIYVQVSKTKTGIKAKVKAIAKPVKVVNTSTAETEVKKAVATDTKVKLITEVATTTVSKEVERKPWIIGGGIVFLILILLIIYKKIYGKGSK